MSELPIAPFVVVGSGPAGWSALEALVAGGRRPTLIDIGIRDALRLPSNDLSSSDAASFSLKTRHGSSHMYHYPSNQIEQGELRHKIPLSGAFGGLSTVWGTNLQLCREACLEEFVDREYTTAVDAVLGSMFHSGGIDDLTEVSSWSGPFEDATPQSTRMRELQIRLARLFSSGPYVAGMARNATRGGRTGCILCGGCMSGCKYGAIFSTEEKVDELISKNKIDVVNALVNQVSHNGELIELTCIGLDDQDPFTISASSVFLAAGSIATTSILMRSGVVPRVTSLDETQVAYLPMLLPGLPSKVETSYTLAQVFVESRNGLAAPSSFHMSIYEPSSEWPERIRAIRPILGKMMSWFMKRYLIAGICFLPAARSGHLELRIESSGIVRISAKRPNEIVREFRSRLRRFRRSVLRAGLFPLVEFAEFPSVGSSFHVGVLKSEGRRCVEGDGSITGCPGLYVVDGASLQALPAGPVTLSVMVNATMIVNRVLEHR